MAVGSSHMQDTISGGGIDCVQEEVQEGVGYGGRGSGLA